MTVVERDGAAEWTERPGAATAAKAERAAERWRRREGPAPQRPRLAWASMRVWLRCVLDRRCATASIAAVAGMPWRPDAAAAAAADSDVGPIVCLRTLTAALDFTHTQHTAAWSKGMHAMCEPLSFVADSDARCAAGHAGDELGAVVRTTVPSPRRNCCATAAVSVCCCWHRSTAIASASSHPSLCVFAHLLSLLLLVCDVRCECAVCAAAGGPIGHRTLPAKHTAAETETPPGTTATAALAAPPPPPQHCTCTYALCRSHAPSNMGAPNEWGKQKDAGQRRRYVRRASSASPWGPGQHTRTTLPPPHVSEGIGLHCQGHRCFCCVRCVGTEVDGQRGTVADTTVNNRRSGHSRAEP